MSIPWKSVIFDPAGVSDALDIPPDDIRITGNTLFPGLAHKEISIVVIILLSLLY